MKFKPTVGFQSASLQGYVSVSYQELITVFGLPTDDGDGYKVDARWKLTFEDGTHATIYNYKDGKNYEGSDGLDVEDIDEWHVGGAWSHAVQCVGNLLNVPYSIV